MNQRTERLAAEVQTMLGEILARGEIRDSRVRDVGIITITWVRVTGDLSEARAGFTVFGADAAALERVRQGLKAACPYLQRELGRRLRTRKTATIAFEVDRTLDNAFRVDRLLRESAAAPPSGADGSTAATVVAGDAGGDGGDGEAGGTAGSHADGVAPEK